MNSNPDGVLFGVNRTLQPWLRYEYAWRRELLRPKLRVYAHVALHDEIQVRMAMNCSNHIRILRQENLPCISVATILLIFRRKIMSQRTSPPDLFLVEILYELILQNEHL